MAFFLEKMMNKIHRVCMLINQTSSDLEDSCYNMNISGMVNICFNSWNVDKLIWQFAYSKWIHNEEIGELNPQNMDAFELDVLYNGFYYNIDKLDIYHAVSATKLCNATLNIDVSRLVKISSRYFLWNFLTKYHAVNFFKFLN